MESRLTYIYYSEKTFIIYANVKKIFIEYPYSRAGDGFVQHSFIPNSFLAT